MKFDLSGARSSLDAQFGPSLWNIQSVTLQLSSSPHGNPIFNNIAAGQFGVSLMRNNSWVEGTGNGGVPSNDGISYDSLKNTYINNATDQALGTFDFPGGSSGTNNYSLSLTQGMVSALLAGDNLSLRLFAADSQVSYLFSSRNAGGSVRPALLITAIPEPGSAALWVLGLAAGALWQRRKNKIFGNNFRAPVSHNK